MHTGVQWLALAQPVLDQSPQFPCHERGRIRLLKGASLGDNIGGCIWSLDGGISWGGPPSLDILDLLVVKDVFRWPWLVGRGEEVEGVGGQSSGQRSRDLTLRRHVTR